MIDRNSLLLAIVTSLAIAGLASQLLPFTPVPKALAVGLIAAAVFVTVRSAMSQKRVT